MRQASEHRSGLKRQHAIRNKAGYHEHMGHPAIDIDSMPPEDRLQLLGELWDSLRRVPDSIPVPDTHRDELDARLRASAVAKPNRLAAELLPFLQQVGF